MVPGALGAGRTADAEVLLLNLSSLVHAVEMTPSGMIGTPVHDFVYCPECSLKSCSAQYIEDVIGVHVGLPTSPCRSSYNTYKTYMDSDDIFYILRRTALQAALWAVRKIVHWCLSHTTWCDFHSM